jgi:hypothetical protein
MEKINIEGLNDRQMQICDLLWGCNTSEDVEALISSLPTLQDKLDARSLVNLMLYEELEKPKYDVLWDDARVFATDFINEIRNLE